MKIKIEVSARHCHLSLKDLETLFGKNYQLRFLKKLSQPGQFASQETIELKMPEGCLNNIRILGPVRGKTQIELSQTDAHQLKINPPVRQSGDIKNSVGAELIGPKGTIKMEEGVIIAARHIHCDPSSAKKLGLKNNQKVSVKIKGIRAITFNEVIVRIDKNFLLAFHIDIDEGNAALNFNREKKANYYGLLIKN